MNKIKLGVIFGGMSTENEISVISGTSILNNLDKEKYDIYPIYIDKQGTWYKYLEDINKIKGINEKVEKKEKIENIIQHLKQLQVIFPVLHGKYGEDGTIQGLFEMLKIPYVGCKVLSSCIGMDKVYSKIIFEKAGIDQAKYAYIRKIDEKYVYINSYLEEEMNIERIIKKVKFPMFVKPSNSGSSVGIRKVINIKELKEAIEYAAKYDNKILIEEEIKGKELECAVLGNNEVISSSVGQIKPAEEFYSYDAKYNNNESKTIIPAEISDEKENEIKELAIKAFKAIDGSGLARIDFFIKEDTDEVYLNEINTLPGFTSISMYPKLFEHAGIKYSELLDKLINLAIENKMWNEKMCKKSKNN